MKGMTKFQLILILIFAVFIVAGVMIFAFSRGGGNAQVLPVTVWGTLPNQSFQDMLRLSGIDKNQTIVINYVEKRPDTFDEQFVTALADGKGPDLFFLSQDSILKHQNRIFPIPYKNISERDFKDTFIQGSEVFLGKDGVLAIPFIVDPMVMYWNRTLFSNEGLSRPPSLWQEIYSITNRLTKKNNAFNITQTAIPFGEYSNISNATELLSLLAMQAGNPIVTNSNGSLNVVLSEKLNLPVAPAEEALNFYTEFSNPTKVFYSWNRSLPLSRDFFTAGDSALYFGFASELPLISQKNPNLNFDVSMVPQSQTSKNKITFGRFYGLALNKQSVNIAGAFAVAQVLSSGVFQDALNKITTLPPVRRDLLAIKPESAYQAVFFDSAIQARTWLAPGRVETNNVFKNLIESVTSGRLRVSEAVNKADAELTSLVNNSNK